MTHADLQDARTSKFERLQRLAAAPLSLGRKCAAAAFKAGCCCWASSKVLVSYFLLCLTTRCALQILRMSRLLCILVVKKVLTCTYTVDINQYYADAKTKRPCYRIKIHKLTSQRLDVTMHLLPLCTVLTSGNLALSLRMYG